ncbi:MAG: cytochrome P450, partial [Acidimicrobiia bacterium]|nr:cytochrome P450 [Acidimicrobiia bacterium]
MVSSDEYADLTSNDTFVAGVPHATFKRLRDTDPVSWVDEADGAGFWAITRWADVRAISGDPARFTTTKGIRMEEWDEEQTVNRRTMMNFDPPEHTRLRRLVNRGFTRRVVQTYEEAIRILTREVLDEALVRDELDFVEDVARMLPMRMLGRLLGVPDRDGPHLVRLGDALIGNADPEFTDFPIDLTDTEEFRLLPFRSPATLELYRYAEAAAAERRARP